MAISGVAPPAGETRPRPVDLNLLPPEYRRRPGGGLAPILALVLLALVVGALAILQLRVRSDDELARWSARLGRAQTTQSALAVVETSAQEYQGRAAALQQKMDVMQADYLDLANRRVSWSQVYQAIVNAAPPDMGMASIQQRNYQLLVQGTGSSDASITGFAQKLNGSQLFSSVVIQSISEAPPGSGLPPIGAGPPPPNVPLPPVQQPTILAPIQQPVQATAQPVPSYTPAPQPTVAPAATPTRPPAISPTAAPGAGEFRVADSIRTTIPGNVDRFSIIRGKIVDENGAPVRGLSVKLTGEGVSEEKAAADGSFEFQVQKKGVYNVTLVGVRSDAASGLSTNVPGVTGFHVWEVTFKRVGGRAGSSRPEPPVADGRQIDAGAPVAPDTLPADAARPPLATFSFTIVAQVKPGAGQVPVSDAVASPSTPISGTAPISGTTAPGDPAERRFGARP